MTDTGTNPTNDASALQIAERARELLKEPKHWIKGGYARTKHGYSVGIEADNAHCFCTAGAIRRASYELTENQFSDAAVSVMRVVSLCATGSDIDALGNIIGWNDLSGTIHDDVMSAFDCAITSLHARSNKSLTPGELG